MLLFIFGDANMNIAYADILTGVEAEPEFKVAGKEVPEGIQAEPSLMVGERFDDNIDLTGNPVSDFVTLLTPQFNLIDKSLRLQSSLRYQADIAFFKEHSDRNAVTQTASLDTRYGLSQLVELNLQDRFVYSPDATDISSTGIVTSRVKQYNNNLSAGFSQKLSVRTNVALEYIYQIQRYEGPGFVDSTVHGIQLALRHDLTPIDKIKLGAGFRYFYYPDIAVQRVYTVGIGDTHRFSETDFLDVSGGANLYRDPENHYSPSAFFAVAFRKLWEYVRANFTYERDFSAIGGIASGSINTSTGPLNTESVSLGIEVTLTNKLRANLSGSYATNKTVSGSAVDVLSYSGNAELDYAVLAWLKGQLRYSYFQQNSHTTVGSDFKRNQAFVGLTATFPK